MKRAIRNHWRDVVAMIGLVIIAVGVGGYILSNQRLRFPFLEEEPYAVWIELPNAQGVTPGQGQTVRVAGMQVGDIGKVELAGGVARVRMDLEVEYDDLVHTDATVLLRPRTGLKDMFLALDPGTHTKPVVKEGGTIGVGNALPDVNQDEILAMLDADTRAYLKLLVNGAGGGLRNRGGDLREVFRRLGPLHRDLAVLNSEVVKRKRNLARLVHNYGGTIDRLGREDAELAALVSGQSKVFTRLAREDARISEAVRRLPGTLAQTEKTLGKVNELGRVVGPALDAMRPAVRQLHEANKELRPLAEKGEPVLRENVRPLVRAARPYLDDVRPAATNLVKASPDLQKSFYELNRFFNMASYNPGGREKLTGNYNADRARQEGFLFWAAWVAHNSNSLFSTADASGPYRRVLLAASCTTYREMLAQAGAAAPLLVQVLGIEKLLADLDLCPPS